MKSSEVKYYFTDSFANPFLCVKSKISPKNTSTKPQTQYLIRGYTMHVLRNTDCGSAAHCNPNVEQIPIMYDFYYSDRDYIGKMLDEFGLINMPARRNGNEGGNGRCYDPVVGRFLSPDIIVQNPNNTQCYNRYSYCINNPLKYSDPSGWVSIGNSNWAVQLAELNRTLWMNSYTRYCGMKYMFSQMVLAQLIAVNGRPEESRGGGGGNSINNISTVMIPAIGNIVLKGLGLTGNSSISEYDFSEGTDYTISDGWPPDGAINCAPWRPTQNQVQNTPKETPSKNVDSYDKGNTIGDLTAGTSGMATLGAFATIGIEGAKRAGQCFTGVGAGIAIGGTINMIYISRKDNYFSAGEITRCGLNGAAIFGSFSDNPWVQGGFATYVGLDAMGAWNDYYRQIDMVENNLTIGKIYFPASFYMQLYSGFFIPWGGKYQFGFYIKN